jgi:hypothetical protein
MLVSGATTEVTIQAIPDFVFRRGGIPVQDLLGNHEHSRRAETALQAMLVPEGFLYPMELTARFRQAFDRHNIRPIRLDREHRATLYRAAIHLDGAGSAERCLAPDVRSGKPDYFT